MPKEQNKADNYCEKAYAGDTKAMNNLGVCYERGTGVKVSLELAFDWYKSPPYYYSLSSAAASELCWVCKSGIRRRCIREGPAMLIISREGTSSNMAFL